MSATASEDELVDTLVRDTERIRDTAASLGAAFRSVEISYPSPALVRAVYAAESLYDRIEEEFGLLSSTAAGERMGSRAQASRNLAVAARKDGRLLGLRRGRYVQFPGFQFHDRGLRPVVADLIRLALEHDRSETGLVQWLMSPTTYLEGRRPVDVIDQPDALLEAARDAFGVQW